MSGGAWNYQQFKLQEQAEEISKLLAAVAETEHIVDWAVCGDTLRENAKEELFQLWEKTFNSVYGRS